MVIGFVNRLAAVLPAHLVGTGGVIQRVRIALAGEESLRGAAAAQAAAELDRAGLDGVSTPTEIKNLPRKLRYSLIRQMAPHFSTLWGNSDSGLRTSEKATRTLDKMSRDPSVVFQVQFNRQGELVSTSTIVNRDEPAFRDTGPNGTDRYGDHWVSNVFTSPHYRNQGRATAQIKSLQEIAAQRGWPHLWLYCRDVQDRVNLPQYYNTKLGFTKVGEEMVNDDGREEKENIMRFDIPKA